MISIPVRPALLILLVLELPACGAAARRPPRDATQDPDFQAALRERKAEFPRQRDALAAGVYEEFVHPDSLGPADATDADRTRAMLEDGRQRSVGRSQATAPDGEDPSTDALLRTLPRRPADDAARSRSEELPQRAGRESQATPPELAPRESAAAPPERVRRDPAAVSPGPSPVFALQLGAFGGEDAARERADAASRLAPHLPVELTWEGGLARVFLGSFPTRVEAAEALAELSRRGLGPAFVVQRR